MARASRCDREDAGSIPVVGPKGEMGCLRMPKPPTIRVNVIRVFNAIRVFNDESTTVGGHYLESYSRYDGPAEENTISGDKWWWDWGEYLGPGEAGRLEMLGRITSS